MPSVEIRHWAFLLDLSIAIKFRKFKKMNQNCLSCGENLVGEYCHACGEKTVSDKDFTLKKIIGDGINVFTNLDSKFFQSFYSLLFKPGKLTLEYLNGRRKPYMKPFQIFLIVTILFFLFIPDFDVFLVPSRWFFSEVSEFGINIMDLVRAKMAEKSMTQEEIALLYDSEVKSYSKLFMVVLLPLLALSTFFLKRKSMRKYGKHFILATHNFSFVVLWFLIAFYVVVASPIHFPKWLGVSVIFGVIIIYLAFSFRKVWDEKLWKAGLRSLLIFTFLFIIVFLYRVGISYFTLKWL